MNPPSVTPRVAGVDGARRGWVMATIGPDPTHDSELTFGAEFTVLLERCRVSRLAAVGVDIPIGFAADGHRDAERLARARLGRRASTLFAMPAHAALDVDDWSRALDLNRRIAGKGFSKQAFGLLAGSREVRAALSPSEQPWCSEVHPESSFTAMNDGEPLPSKHTDEGRSQRLGLVTSLIAADAADRVATSGVSPVDALDAYAAAWTALRLSRGEADVLGDGHDPDGYSLTIAV